MWRRQWHPTPVLLPGKPHGWRNLVGCSPWGCLESDTTEQLHFQVLEKEMATHSSVLAWRIPGTGSLVVCCLWGRWVRHDSDFTFTFYFHALEKEMATHSSNLAWKIPWMEEPGGLQSMGSLRIRHDWSDLAAAATYLCANLPSVVFTMKLWEVIFTSFMSIHGCL